MGLFFQPRALTGQVAVIVLVNVRSDAVGCAFVSAVCKTKHDVGRQQCECQASKHNLVNNCRNCGRVVCEQEGSGPCFFCHSLVCSFFTFYFVFSVMCLIFVMHIFVLSYSPRTC